MQLTHPRNLIGIAIFAVAACGPPVIYDTDMRPVRNPLVTASVDNGWLAVDSTEAGIRAVLELHLEGPPEADDYMSLYLPKLHCTVSGEHLPVKVLREAPSCPIPGSRPAHCDEATSLEECEQLATRIPDRCLFTIRAEFLFDQMPHLDENTHYFTFAQYDKPVFWTKVP